MNILIVDDQPDNLYMLETLLKGYGHDVAAAANGAEALQRLEAGAFDLIVSDVLMPVMDGFELCRRVRKDERLRPIRFIIYTATYTGPEDEALALKIGADRFVQKPCEPDAFMKMVSDVMADAGRTSGAPSTPDHEEEIFKLYNERLVRKLEQKMAQLEQEVQSRRGAERAAQDAAERWQATFDAMLDPAAILNADGVVMQYNRAFAELFDRDIASLAGNKCCRLLHETDAPVPGCPLVCAGESGRRETMALSFGRRDFVVVVDPLRGAGGHIAEFVHIMRDVTEQKRAERQLEADKAELERLLVRADRSRLALLSVLEDRKAAEEEIRRINEELERRVVERTAQLSALNKELEAFSYSVSHDLRAPLRGIDGFSQALLEDYPDRPLDETGRRYLDRIRKATQNMGRLIDDMLKLSRVTQAEFKREPVDLSRMAREIAKHLRQDNPDRIVDLAIQENVVVQGDRRLLQIAMMNLMDNAFKFTGPREHARIQFGATVGETETICFIRDNGGGFDMAYEGKLFGPFQRLHREEEFPGTGIGLATVRRIVSRHGGQVWAEGEVGKGATFYFTLEN